MEKVKAYGVCLYKKELVDTKILLCKSVSSKAKWGFLKGVQVKNETNEETAIREFQEECGIKVEYSDLEHYFEQINKTKDIGIYLVNYDNIPNINKFFINEQLLSNYLSWENSAVKFFSIKKLPSIKKKQIQLTNDIVNHLKGL